jgi:hypothetical protein
VPDLIRRYGMLSSIRKTYDAAIKARVAFEAAKGEKTIAKIASESSVHPDQLALKLTTGWYCKQMLRSRDKTFSDLERILKSILMEVGLS